MAYLPGAAPAQQQPFFQQAAQQGAPGMAGPVEGIEGFADALNPERYIAKLGAAWEETTGAEDTTWRDRDNWYQRQDAARAAGKPFTEPMPGPK